MERKVGCRRGAAKVFHSQLRDVPSRTAGVGCESVTTVAYTVADLQRSSTQNVPPTDVRTRTAPSEIFQRFASETPEIT